MKMMNCGRSVILPTIIQTYKYKNYDKNILPGVLELKNLTITYFMFVFGKEEKGEWKKKTEGGDRSFYVLSRFRIRDPSLPNPGSRARTSEYQTKACEGAMQLTVARCLIY